ncbi:hypothetical protein Droror1_Dr00004752 [Drosera rotundifolia]
MGFGDLVDLRVCFRVRLGSRCSRAWGCKGRSGSLSLSGRGAASREGCVPDDGKLEQTRALIASLEVGNGLGFVVSYEKILSSHFVEHGILMVLLAAKETTSH